MSVPVTVLCSVFCLLSAGIKPEERVCLFPTCGHLSPDGTQWVMPIHGWVYEDKNTTIMRNLAVRVFRRLLGVPKNTPEARVLKDRGMLFLADNERHTRIDIQIGGRRFSAGKTEGNGHFRTTITLPRDEIAALTRSPAVPTGWISYAILARGEVMTNVTGKVKLVRPEGVSIISDIDDTLKITDTGDHKDAMVNIFAQEYRAVAGMPKRFRQLAEQGAEFHYVSAGPWQLYPPLSEFFQKAGFPEGAWHLASFGWLPTRAVSYFRSSEKAKIPAIEQILADFPKRKFILIGDNVEKDPEIYGEEARKHPSQILHIYIRNVQKDLPDLDRYRQAFRDLPSHRWSLYTKPEEIRMPVKTSATCGVRSPQATRQAKPEKV